MPLCLPLKDHNAINTAEINNNEKPINSAPILKAIKRVEPIAVITPHHSIITKEFNFTLKYEKKYLDKYYY